MIYLANPCTDAVQAAMLAGHLGYIDTPAQGNTRPPGVVWCADNGAFSDRWDSTVWWEFLEAEAHAASSCLFAVAPDIVGDAWRSHMRSAPWLPRIRALGYPVAYVIQNGAEAHPIPWHDFDVLFIGGSMECPTHGAVLHPVKVGHATGSAARYECPTCHARVHEWKLGPIPRVLAAEAVERGKWVHMGRVNSRKRYNYARAIGCSSVDGTFLKHGPDKRLPELLSWLQPDLLTR